MLDTFPIDTASPRDPVDLLPARLDQCAGILNAISNTYDEELSEYQTPPQYLQKALRAVTDLLDEARRAAHAVAMAHRPKAAKT